MHEAAMDKTKSVSVNVLMQQQCTAQGFHSTVVKMHKRSLTSKNRDEEQGYVKAAKSRLPSRAPQVSYTRA